MMALNNGLVQEVIGDGLGVLRRRYPDLLALSVVAQFSGLLLDYVFGPGKGVTGAALSLPLSIVNTAIGLYVFSGQVRLVASETKGETMGLGEALGRGTVNLWSLFVTGLLVILGVALGSLLLVVPGIWFLIAASLATVVTVMEGKAGIEAIKASFRMTEGHRPDILKLALLSLAVSILVMGVLAIPMRIVSSVDTVFVRELLGRIPTALLDPLLPVGTTLVYLKLKGKDI